LVDGRRDSKGSSFTVPALESPVVKLVALVKSHVYANHLVGFNYHTGFKSFASVPQLKTRLSYSLSGVALQVSGRAVQVIRAWCGENGRLDG